SGRWRSPRVERRAAPAGPTRPAGTPSRPLSLRGRPDVALAVLRVCVGALLSIVGAALVMWTQAARGRAARANPRGEGTGAPGPLLTTGPYGLCRHPLLLGALALLAGLGLLRGAGPVTAVVLVGLGLAAVGLSLLEERHLLRQHGTGYRQYRAAVPFLIPRWRRRR
ncbi:MAG TPA: methyltransferase, partial [Candidatus Dormibacteraeota bacterium]|nr:methyltransferase [Candidatus Dormibacteraeota bacterium]